MGRAEYCRARVQLRHPPRVRTSSSLSAPALVSGGASFIVAGGGGGASPCPDMSRASALLLSTPVSQHLVWILASYLPRPVRGK